MCNKKMIDKFQDIKDNIKFRQLIHFDKNLGFEFWHNEYNNAMVMVIVIPDLYRSVWLSNVFDISQFKYNCKLRIESDLLLTHWGGTGL